MTSRHVYESGAWKNYTLIYDAENSLATVSGPVTANFKYDGDSKRVRAAINSIRSEGDLNRHLDYLHFIGQARSGGTASGLALV